MKTKKWLLASMVLMLLSLAWNTAAARPAASVELSGFLSAIWGDGPAEAPGSVVTYWLTTASGETVALDFENPSGGWWRFHGQGVILQGQWEAPSRENAAPRALRVASLQRAGTTSQATAPTDSRPWVSILCKFKDVAAEPKTLSYFIKMYASTYPGLDHYWHEQSYDQANLLGSQASGWYTLPNSRDYYLPGGSLDFGRAATDCTAVADAAIDFTPFTGINLMFNGELDGYAWGGGNYMCLDGLCKVWSMTWEPPWGYNNIGVIEHENGHGFGLPHSSGNYGATYDNQWDVMSDLWTQCSRPGASDPIYGCMGEHTIGYHKDMLGWIPGKRKLTVSPGEAAQVTLEKLALPGAADFLLVKVPIGTTGRFYTVEARRHNGYDSWLAGNAVVIHEIDESRPAPAHVIDMDGNGNTGDAGAMWLPEEIFTDATNHISISVLSETASGFVVLVRNGTVAVSSVIISGPSLGEIGVSYTFTATVQPALADQPITYQWQISGQAPITHTGGLIDHVTVSWPDSGAKTIQVTASNTAGNAPDSHTITIASTPLEKIYLPLTRK